jgi:hypothetical protein
MKSGKITSLTLLNTGKIRVSILVLNRATEEIDVPFDEGKILTIGETVTIDVRITREAEPQV